LEAGVESCIDGRTPNFDGVRYKIVMMEVADQENATEIKDPVKVDSETTESSKEPLVTESDDRTSSVSSASFLIMSLATLVFALAFLI
jgi:ABC-type Na+ efflux pump permease subunit